MTTERPVLSWCIVARNAETQPKHGGGTWALADTIASLRERTPNAEIVVVVQPSSDNTLQMAKEHADVVQLYKGPRGDWDEDMLACDDMRAARERSFELASGRWIAWADADDRVEGGAEAERLLKLNGYWKPKRSMQRVYDADDAPRQTSLEDLLTTLEHETPDITGIWCPYLYQRDENDVAEIWQDRERIIRNDDPPKWRWGEAAHEILVPIGDYRPPRFDLAHLLWVHEKRWDADAYDYSNVRHYKILLEQYHAGQATARRCLYLAQYARFLDPTREQEFLAQAHAQSMTTLDRSRALTALAEHLMRRGLYHDAIEHYAAAHAMEPRMPDAYYAAGIAASQMKDHARAVQYLSKGVDCELSPGTMVPPRHHAMRWPTMLSMELQALAKQQVDLGLHDIAQQNLDAAVVYAQRVADYEHIAHDKLEADSRMLATQNAAKAQRQMVAITELWQFLVDNDETLKACDLLKTIPHNLLDHPLTIELERRARVIERHAQDVDAYAAFYRADDETGYQDVDPEALAEPRKAWIADWVATHRPTARVLDLGASGGIVGIPLLQRCPDIEYVAVDIHAAPITDLRRHVDKRGLTDRNVTYATLAKPFPEGLQVRMALRDRDVAFDVIVWTEVIEHVPDPVASLASIRTLLKPDGVLFVTTPWGAYDAGHPLGETCHGNPRDPRGHLRAYTARQLRDDLRDGGFDVDRLYNATPDRARGASMHALSRPSAAKTRQPIAFVVPGALWDWNASTVLSDGMGASETSIVRLAQRLAPTRTVNVYGPVPTPEVHDGVGYWPVAQLRHHRDDPHTHFVVSRSPGFAPELQRQIGERGADQRRTLWLQDAIYPDLTDDTIAAYDRIVCVSEWHKQAMHDRHGAPLEQIAVAYNFVLPNAYRLDDPPERKPHHFVWMSSPDRGINGLLRMWPRIRAALLDATLDIFYGWRGCAILGAGGQAGWSERFQQKRREYDRLRHQPGVRERGMVPPDQMARELLSASVWPYHNRDFEETCCAAALEVRAAGCVPVTSALAALNETAACEQGFLIDPTADDYDDRFLDAVLAAVETPKTARQRMSDEVCDRFSLDALLPIWDEILG